MSHHCLRARVGALLIGGILMMKPATGAQQARGAAPASLPAEVGMVGVNLACGEFGKEPSVYGKTYIYPAEKQYEYWAGKGLFVVRLPFRWQRLQKKLMADLDETEMARIDASIALAHNRLHPSIWQIYSNPMTQDIR